MEVLDSLTTLTKAMEKAAQVRVRDDPYGVFIEHIRGGLGTEMLPVRTVSDKKQTNTCMLSLLLIATVLMELIFLDLKCFFLMNELYTDVKMIFYSTGFDAAIDHTKKVTGLCYISFT